MKTNALKFSALAIGMFALPLHLSAQTPIEDEELIESGSNWEYLLYSDASNVPVDPVTANPNFATTWHTPSSYSGTPAFLTGQAMLGWGAVPNTGNLIVTDMWANRDAVAIPPTGQRFTCYLRTTFTPTDAVDQIRIDGRIDDGAIVYLNGVEVARINVADGLVNEWTLLADGNGSEAANIVTDITLTNPLPAGVSVDLAVSLHNTSDTSSDIGFDARVVSLIPPPPVPAPNDNFTSAEVLVDPLPFTIAGRSHNTIGGSGATVEANEPIHAGDNGGASVWYSWTPTQTQRVSIATDGSTFDTLLGVYTGSSVGALTAVASSDDATFYALSRVEFEAQAGTTYLIAVDGNAGEFGDITLNFAAAPVRFERTESLIAAGSTWDYLLANNTVRTVDPDAQDPDGDFYTTWQTTADYDGPAFAAGPAILGYGEILDGPIATEVFPPASGSRNAVMYLRNTFTPVAATTNLAFHGTVDDGAIIYIDGVEVTRLNMNPLTSPNNFRALALGSNHGGPNNESFPQLAIVALELPAGVPVELAISVHNASATSSDMGFDMEVYSTTTPPPPLDDFVAFITPTATAGQYEVSWVSQLGAVYDVEFSPDLQSWSVIMTDVAGGTTGIDSILDTPTGAPGYYRIVRK